ncbi:MAG: YtxH domain-containing protein [Polyangiales bacterium]|nr:YtxH domain-containing protein [Sandaracinus sp.]
MKTPSILRDASMLIDRLEARGVDIDGMLSRVGLTRTSRAGGYGMLAMVGSFSVGLAVGAGLGVLFAPQTGEDSRRTIRTKAEDLVSRVMGSTDESSDDDVTSIRSKSKNGASAHA